MAAEIPQTLIYRGSQINVAPLLKVENFTNWKKRNANHDRDFELASLFGKLKYEENVIDRIYDTEKKKSLTTATPLPTAFILTYIVKDFQDSPADEEDTRSSHFARDYFSKTFVPSYSSPFQNDPQPKFISSSQQHKPKLRPNKDFEAKYNKVKAKLAFLSSGASTSKSSQVQNQGLVVEAYELDEEEVSSDDNVIVEVKVLMALVDDESGIMGKESVRNGEWIKIFVRKSDIRKPIWYRDSGCSRHMTGVKSNLHKYVEQPDPKVVFEDDSTCTTEGYGSIKCNGIVFTKVASLNGLKYNLVSISQLCDAKYIVQFDEKRGIIFNSNKEVVMIALRVRDVYVLYMTSSTQESCFFSKASESLNWLWHKRLSRLNFKTINQLAKQNLVIGLPSLIYSKDKPCSSCEKGKHHRSMKNTRLS
ncbi:retrovirus-related pol polyprotein from transposon TNT 1-94 [Tanacetum coccineum]